MQVLYLGPVENDFNQKSSFSYSNLTAAVEIRPARIAAFILLLAAAFRPEGQELSEGRGAWTKPRPPSDSSFATAPPGAQPAGARQ